MQSSHERGLKQSVDWRLVIYYLALVFIGWVNIYASIHSSNPSSIFDVTCRSGKQFIWILTSFGLAALILFVISPRFWEGMSIPIYIFVVILLVAVIFLGVEVKGSRSWFEFGPVRFQPAEISKISTSLLLAMLMSRANFKLTRLKDFMMVCLVILLPMAVILGESETGSALVYVGFIFVLYREGLSGWFLSAIGLCILLFILTLTASPTVSIIVLIGVVTFCNAIEKNRFWHWFIIFVPIMAALALLPWAWGLLVKTTSGNHFLAFLGTIKPVYVIVFIAVCSLPFFIVKAYRSRSTYMTVSIITFIMGVILTFSTDFIFNSVLQEHQRKRIEVLLGMKDDPSGVGYNVNQSMIAIGSGGVIGKGFLNGTQTTYGFVPEQSTDFIFCTVGEEWGFLGCATVIILYVLMIWRLVKDAEDSRESFTRIYGYCVASCIFMHLFINIGMTIGLMPVIGIPLPFLSYGGSSLWAFTVLLFIFVALNREEHKYF